VRAVFADTFYWVALTNPDDSRYQDALDLDDLLTGAVIVTTDEILAEFMTFFSAGPCQRSRAAAIVRSLLADSEVRVISQSRESFLSGLSLYEARPDKLHPDGLHFHADDAKGRADRGSHQRLAFRAGRLQRSVSRLVKRLPALP